MNWNNRQEKILTILISSDLPVTLKRLSEQLQVSTRTIQRELIWIKGMIQPYGLDLDSKTGVGIVILGSYESKCKAIQQLSQVNTQQLLSSDERLERLKIMILTHNEPVKLYVLSKELDVSEATISNDLSKIEDWFSSYQLQLIRKPGLGVYLCGEEKQIRQAILELLYGQYSTEEIITVWQNDEQSTLVHSNQQLSIWNDLFHFIDQAQLQMIEHAVLELKEKFQFRMEDNAFVGLVVHIALAIQRLRAGEGIEIDEGALIDLKVSEEYDWAVHLCQNLSERLEISIPDSEKLYITIHLLGANARKIYEDIKKNKSAQYTRDMIYIASDYLQISLIDDHDLFVYLSQHLDSALFRISMGMKIRNPLLKQVKKNYEHMYNTACHVVKYLEKKTELVIPEEEIGYLAMHFGAAVLRKERDLKRTYRTIVVCSSGIGTSRLLAAQLRNELPNIVVINTVPVRTLSEWLAKNEAIDFIISTIKIKEEHLPVIEVSPFLTQEDIMKIETRIAVLTERSTLSNENKVPLNQIIQRVNQYGEAVSQIVEHFHFQEGLNYETKEAMIRVAAEGALRMHPESDVNRIEQDLLHREQMGTWIATGTGLAMIHYRTRGIPKLMIAIYRSEKPIQWNGREHAHSVLVLLVPEQASQEQLEMLGEISASLIEDSNIQCFASGTELEIKQVIQYILSTAYSTKAKELIGG